MNQESSSATDVDSLLEEVEKLHALETDALKRMNATLLDEVTTAKEALCERLASLSGRLEPRHRERIAKIRKHATMNQLLLVHARDSVRSILSTATGVSFDAFPGARRSQGQEGVRLNVRV